MSREDSARRPGSPRDGAAVRIVRSHAASRRSEGRHRGAAARRRARWTTCRTRSRSRPSPPARRRSRPPPRARSTSRSPATPRRSSVRRPTPRSKVVSAYDGGGNRRSDSGARRLADPVDRRSARQEHRGRQGQLGARPHPRPAQEGRAVAVRCEAGVPAARRRACRRSASGRPTRGRSGTPTPRRPQRSCRCAASAKRETSPTATGSVSPSDDSAGRPEAQHRAGRPAGAIREGGALGEGPPPGVGPELRRRSRSRSEGGGGRAGPQPATAHRTRRRRSWPPSRRSPTCSPSRSRSLRRHRSSPTGSTAATTTRCGPC